MKKKIIYFFSVLLVILLAIISINTYNRLRDVWFLNRAEIYSDSLPQKTLANLQKIKHPKKFKMPEQISYNYMLIKNMRLLGNNIGNDSIFDAIISYYQTKNDSIKLEDAWYFKGLNNYEKAEYPKALKAIERAMHYSRSGTKSDRINYLSLIGYSYLNADNSRKAIELFEQALKLVYQKNDTALIISSLLSLSEAYKKNNERDKFFQYIGTALDLSRKIGNKELETNILYMYVDYYKSNNDPKMAIKYINEVKKIRYNRKDIPSLNLNKAILFHKQNMLDSAFHYAQLAATGNDEYVSDLAYSLLSELNNRKGRYAEGLLNLQNGQEMENSFSQGLELGDMQKKYEQKKLENENNILKIKQKEQQLMLLAGSIFMILLLIIFYFFWLQNKQKRERMENQNRTMKLEHENLVLKQHQEISALREKEAMLRESLFKRINFFNKFPSLGNGNGSSGEHNKIKLNSEEWTELTHNISDAYPGFIDKLKQCAPTLNEDDIRFCSLLKINVNMQDLSDIYCVSKAAITKRKYRLKTEKFNVLDNTTPLDLVIQRM